MAFFYEIFPVFIFFIVFKWYDIYAATVVGIVTSLMQVIITRLYMKIWDKKQLFTLSVFVIFGGMTLYFHNPLFVKWKPSVVFWVFAMVIFTTHFVGKKPVIEHLMAKMMQEKATIPRFVWYRLNLFWGLFFAILGAINLYVAYSFDSNTWVNFKFYGISIALFCFSVFQALYLSRYFEAVKSGDKQDG